MEAQATATLPAELVAPLEAIGRLNIWVRSESYRRGCWGAARAIYWLKCQAIRRAALEGCATFRRVKTRVKCNRCNGTTRYWGWWAQTEADTVRCRHCDSLGMATLEFIESTIGGHVWHTPERESWQLSKYAAGKYDIELPAPEAFDWVDWLPNQPGLDLSIPDVARDLNTVETFFKERPGKRSVDSNAGYYEVDDFAYKLFIGEKDGTRCTFCGGPPEPCACHVTRDHISWHDFACKACRVANSNGGNTFVAFPVPVELLNDPHIQQWLERRSLTQPRR